MMDVDDFGDFGFSLVDEEELDAVQQAVEQVQTTTSQTEAVKQDLANTDKKLESLYNAIQPLLRNLAESEDKPYIYWPDRVKKINLFKAHLEKIYMS